MTGTALRRDAAAGLTLIEVLIVLVVIGVASAATLLGLNAADRGARAEGEALRLSQHLTLAVDEALIAGLPLALQWDDTGYRLLRWDGAAWQAAEGRLGARHDLTGALRLSVPGADGPLLIAPSGIGAERFLVIAASGQGWQVRFDGFTAAALPEGGA